MRVFNRLTREWSDQLPSTALSSQLIIKGPLVIDREHLSATQLLVDNDDGTVIIEAEGKRAKCALKQGDNPDSIRASLTIAANIADLLDTGFDRAEVAQEVDPLVRVADVEQLLERDRIEVAFDTNAPHLRSVCHLPFTELRFSAMRMPVDRARRISRRAIQVLASRSEDWLRVGSTGVTPRVIEALERDETVDLYENRVTARLLDSVRLHLRGLLSTYSELSPLMQTVVGPHRKRERLAQLWGLQRPDDDLRNTLRLRRLHVQKLLVLVEGLRESRLYRGVPRRARVEQPIRITNLFDDDVDYRGVRRLWAEWWHQRGHRGTPNERRSERLNEAQGFFSFAWLALAWSLTQLDEERDIRGSVDSIEVDTPCINAQLRQSPGSESSGSWVVASRFADGGEMTNILIVAIACELLRLPERQMQRVVDELRGMSVSDDYQAMVILYPGTTHDLDALPPEVQLSAMYNAGVLSTEGRADLWLVPISPLDLESTERIDRTLRWLILSNAFLAYPPDFPAPAFAHDILMPQTFLEQSTAGSFRVVAPPKPEDMKQISHDVDKQRRQLLTQLRGRGQVDAERLDATHTAFQDAAARLNICIRCPTCSGPGRLEPRSAETFESTCMSCSSRWGLRHDPRSNDRVPYIWIGQDLANAPAGEDLSRWLGRDVLAEPCQHREVQLGDELINPWSGRCTAEQQRGASCARCLRPPA